MAVNSGFRYSRSALLHLDKNLPISSKLRRKLWFFRILQPRQDLINKPSSFNSIIPVRITHRLHGHSIHDSRPQRHRFLSAFPRANQHHRHPTCPKTISFGLLNVRSLHQKVDDVIDLHRRLDVFLITETWHDEDSVCIRRLCNESYLVAEQARPRLRSDSISTNHGGVAIVSKPHVRQQRLSLNFTPLTFEVICARLSSGISTLIVVLIYRTGAVSSLFYDELSQILDELVLLSCPLLVTGDLNVHIERTADAHTRSLFGLLDSYGLSCRVNSPTHCLGGTLDVVFAPSDVMISPIVLTDTGLSDHLLLTWSVPFILSPPNYFTSLSRPWKRLDINAFLDALRLSPLCLSSWDGLSVDQLVNLFDSNICSLLDRLLPLRSVTLRRRPSDCWFDDECRHAKRRLRRLERCVNRLRRSSAKTFTQAENQWRRCLIAYRTLLRRKREAYWCTKAMSERYRPRDLWRTMNTLLGRGRTPPCDAISASDLHHHFETKVCDVLSSTEGAPSASFTSAPPGAIFSKFDVVSPETVAAVIDKLPNKSSACDLIPTDLLKRCVFLLLPFLTHLFNESLSSGYFPTKWKKVTIKPVLKKGMKNSLDPSSYRPISNLPVLSKVLERLVAIQLRRYLTLHHLLPPVQSAYRASHSTESALQKIVSDVLIFLDGGKLSLLSFLDLSAAFDTVHHDTLLDRLRLSFGVSDIAFRWFSSFLCERQQSVVYQSMSSSQSSVLCGVPQGSVLGPLLFICYTADLASLVQTFDFNIHMYADDVTIYGSCHPSDTSDLSQRLSVCLDAVILWLKSNRLQLNAEKTKFLWCSSTQRRRSRPNDPIRIGNSHAQPSSSVKCLGVYLDCDLSFSVHIAKTAASCFSTLRCLRSIRRSLPRSLLTSLIVSLVFSRLDYCISLLYGSPSHLLKRLQRIIHAAARLIFRASRFSHVSPFLRQLGWLPVADRITLRLAILGHSCRRGAQPGYLTDLVRDVSSVPGSRSLRSASSRSLIVPRVKRPTLGGRSFPVAVARTWNRLPTTIVEENSSFVFKKKLTAFLS